MNRLCASSQVILLTAVAFACLVFGSGTAWGAAGDLDPSFGGDGVAAIDFKYAIASAVAIQEDGAIVAAGTRGSEHQRFTTARILSDGSADTSFGGDGLVSTTFAHSSAAAAMLIQPNGAIVVAGRQGHQIAVARYLANGSLDPSFSADGTFTFKFNNSSSAAVDVGLLPDGDLLVGAEVVRSRRVLLGLVALAPDGTLDASFGENGRTTLPIGKDALVGAVAASDSGIVGAASNGPTMSVIRWGLDGTLDPTFGSGGVTRIPFRRGRDPLPRDIALDESGGVAVAATVWGRTFLPTAALLRLTSAGDLDTSFSSDGIARGRGGINVGAGVAIQGDGNIVLAGGQCCGGGSEVTYAVERFASDGSPDTTFGGDGTVVTTTPETQYTSAGATDVAIQSDGKILTVGPLAYIYGFAAVRYLAS